MNEIILDRCTPPFGHTGNYAPAEQMMVILETIVERHESGEKLYFKFNGGNRAGSIAYLKKFDQKLFVIAKGNKTYFGGDQVEYMFYLNGILAWDNRKNTAKVELVTNGQMSYLEDYEGETVWTKIDKDEKTAQALRDNPPVDMRGQVINVDDKVVFINARYGSGAELDYGVVKEIKAKFRMDYNNKLRTEIIVVVESIRDGYDDEPMISKIKKSNRSILIINDTDLIEDMILAKMEK